MSHSLAGALIKHAKRGDPNISKAALLNALADAQKEIERLRRRCVELKQEISRLKQKTGGKP